MRFISAIVCAGLMTGGLQAQSPIINGPSLGFATDQKGSAIRPIIGIPGASLLADHLQLDTEVRNIHISPKQDFAIATRSEDGQVLVIDLTSDALASHTVASSGDGADLVAFGPSGNIAAVYNNESKAIQVIRHLPQTPTLGREFDASSIGGRGIGLAISDDGALALLRVVDLDGTYVWMLTASGEAWPLQVDQAGAAAFFPNSSDIIVGDDGAHTAFVIRNASTTATRVPVFSADGVNSFSAAATSEDGREVFLADGKSGNVAIVNVDTGANTVVACDCSATGFYTLKGKSVFRLSGISKEPLKLLDASGNEPRILMIPPSAEAQ